MFAPGNAFPPPYRVDEQRFLAASNTVTPLTTTRPLSWSTWIKPPWARMHRIILASAGGGAGAGQTRAAGTAGGGGGGGGSGFAVHIHIPSMFLPNSLVVVVGRGGTGVAVGGSGNGTAGGASGLLLPYVDWPNQFGILETIGGGSGGATGAAGSGGGGGTGPSGGLQWISALGGRSATNQDIWFGSVGGGGSSGAGASGGVQTSSSPIFSGAGGGHVTAGGGNGLGGQPQNHQYPPQTYATVLAAAGSNGENQHWAGFDANYMLIFGPPAGGTGNATGIGGNGGSGYYLTGGAGGGSGVTGGAGGDGGNGFCFIWSW